VLQRSAWEGVWGPCRAPLPDSHGSVNWRFFMITSPFEVSVGTAHRTFPGAETCDKFLKFQPSSSGLIHSGKCDIQIVSG